MSYGRRERYEKPSAVKRQAKNRAIRRTKAQARAATGRLNYNRPALKDWYSPFPMARGDWALMADLPRAGF